MYSLNLHVTFNTCLTRCGVACEAEDEREESLVSDYGL